MSSSVLELFVDRQDQCGLPALVNGLMKDVGSLVCVVFLLAPFQSIRDELWGVFHNGVGAFLSSFAILLGIATISRYFLGWGRTLFSLAVALAMFFVGFVLSNYGWIMLGYVASWVLIIPALGCILAARYKPGFLVAIPALILTAIFGPIRDQSKPTGFPDGLRSIEHGEVCAP